MSVDESRMTQWLREYVPGRWMTRDGEVYYVERMSMEYADAGETMIDYGHLMAPVGVWLEHDGEECPVPIMTRISYRTRDGEEIENAPAVDGAAWRNGYVTHFRIEEPQSEQQAHAMSHPAAIESGGRKHVSDGAWQALQPWPGPRSTIEAAHQKQGTVVLAVAEHDELVRKAGMSRLEFKLACDWMRAASERDALRAEVERLRDAVDRIAWKYSESVDQYMALRAENERLRKGREDEKTVATANADVASGSQGMADAWAHDGLQQPRESGGSQQGGEVEQSLLPSRALWDAMGASLPADALDPRLGMPQPDGEPCEPMSARRWRWLP